MADVSVAIDHECGRKTRRWREGTSKVLAIVTDKYGIVHFEFLDEFFHVSDFVVDGNPKDDETARPVRIVQSDESGNFLPAGRAPGGPEVQQDNVSFE